VPFYVSLYKIYKSKIRPNSFYSGAISGIKICSVASLEISQIMSGTVTMGQGVGLLAILFLRPTQTLESISRLRSLARMSCSRVARVFCRRISASSASRSFSCSTRIASRNSSISFFNLQAETTHGRSTSRLRFRLDAMCASCRLSLSTANCEQICSAKRNF